MEIATNSGHFGLVFEKKSGTEGNHLIIAMSSFLRSSVFKMSPVHTRTQPGVFKFLQFDGRFGDGLEETVGLTVERELCFKCLHCSVDAA